MTGANATTRRDFGVVVPARSANDIESIASGLRKALEMKTNPFFPIVELYDLLHVLVPGAFYNVCPRTEMNDNHGLTLLRTKEIRIREDVFAAACHGDGFGRFTMCHELGHLLMHRGGVALQRARANPPLYMSSEWQSDRFAGALLMPANLVSLGAEPEELMDEFGVSYTAAKVRLSQVEGQKTKGATKQPS